jgi:hypothetical protein
MAAAASLFYGPQARAVPERGEIFRGFSTSDAATTSIPHYNLDRLIRLANVKLDNLKPILEKRVREARQKHLLANPSQDLLNIFGIGLAVFALDPSFVALTLSITDDDEIQVARVNKDKRKIDYLRFGSDPETGEVFLAYNRFVDREPISNQVGNFEEIMPQIVGSIAI